MKIILLILLLPIQFLFADDKVHLDTQPLICGKYTITKTSVPFDVAKNCKIIDIKQKRKWLDKTMKIEFYTDNLKNQKIKCEFNNNVLDKCKVDD